MHGLANVNLVVAIAREIRRPQKTGGHAWREQFAIPVPMIVIRNFAGILTFYNPANASPHRLESLPVAPRSHGIPLLAIIRIRFWIPRPFADAVNQLRRDTIAFDR